MAAKPKAETQVLCGAEEGGRLGRRWCLYSPDRLWSLRGPQVPGERKQEAGGCSQAYLRSPGRRVTWELQAWGALCGVVPNPHLPTYQMFYISSTGFEDLLAVQRGDTYGWGEVVKRALLGPRDKCYFQGTEGLSPAPSPTTTQATAPVSPEVSS